MTNLAAEPYSVDEVVLAFPVPGRGGPSCSTSPDGTTRSGCRSAGRSAPAPHVRENRKGRTGADSAYVLHAGTPGFGFATAASGRCTRPGAATTSTTPSGSSPASSSSAAASCCCPARCGSRTGESYQSPWVYGSYGVGLDEVARRFHRHLRGREPAVSADRPVTLNVWEAVYFDHDLDRLVALAERAAAVGVERYVLDDGWFGSRRHDRAGPRRLGRVARRLAATACIRWSTGCTSLGMQFGLWFEPEMVNPDSDLARAHPEWIMAARADWPSSPAPSRC